MVRGKSGKALPAGRHVSAAAGRYCPAYSL
jgi:hypothetical protein